MKDFVRSALDLMIRMFQVEQFIDSIWLILMVLALVGYVLYRGWLQYHLQ
jgi:hypothetical protein